MWYISRADLVLKKIHYFRREKKPPHIKYTAFTNFRIHDKKKRYGNNKMYAIDNCQPFVACSRWQLAPTAFPFFLKSSGNQNAAHEQSTTRVNWHLIGGSVL